MKFPAYVAVFRVVAACSLPLVFLPEVHGWGGSAVCSGKEETEGKSGDTVHDDMVVHPVNITGKVMSEDGSGDMDRFFFLPTLNDNREFFKVVRPLAPVVGRGVKVLPPGKVRWFFRERGGEVVGRDTEEEEPFEVDLAQVSRENGLGFWVVRISEPPVSCKEAGQEEKNEPMPSLPEETHSPDGTSSRNERDTTRDDVLPASGEKGEFPRPPVQGDGREKTPEPVVPKESSL